MNNHGFFYLRQWNTRKPIGVVAFRKENETQVRVAVSLCAPTDEWDRRLGVLKATAKLDSKKFMLIELDGELVVPGIVGILKALMPRRRRDEGEKYPFERHGVDVLLAGKTLGHQVQRLLEKR